MENCFETLIASYIATKVGVVENFIGTDLIKQLTKNLLLLKNQNLLQAAGVGNAKKLQHNELIRTDTIYWLDKKHNNVYENEFLTQVEAFIVYLNQTCYTGITGYEFHYSLYEKGSFYRKHLDQFQNNSSRKFSLISYLNADWKTNDGGELCIYQEHQNQTITPTQGKTVFFKSDELVHEVLVTQEQRMSITGWLKIEK
ncbi:MAG TPA: 2OG-Fe(II) oxygenase [Flavobacterium sp.]|uniref:2OG-Fe(II) oxygenase n=1 Tax=Flavobacterium sp. TaxID=239 RepID=UPI002B4B8E8C|nr:2OG-Fe(II) oxygenase [Flavobacterium sp.]HLO74250.1 2OG-Fe(II) oxygenase [Flavobacterium sp.]